jgi:hypothetical protein
LTMTEVTDSSEKHSSLLITVVKSFVIGSIPLLKFFVLK